MVRWSKSMERRAGACLAAGLVEFVADRDQGPVDRQASDLEVNVAPSQSEQLAAAHARVGRQPKDGVEAAVDDAGEKVPQLLGVPGAGGGAGKGASFRGVGDRRGVGGDEPAPQRVVEGAA